jgi:hypothetical protein
MRFISIKQGCWHVQLVCECKIKSRLYTNISIPPCLTTCPSCDGSLADIFKHINKQVGYLQIPLEHFFISMNNERKCRIGITTLK